MVAADKSTRPPDGKPTGRPLDWRQDMPGVAQTELLQIGERELKLHWKSPRFGEGLAWCYIPSPSLMPHEGVGFEARAETPEAAREAVIQKVKDRLQQRAAQA